MKVSLKNKLIFIAFLIVGTLFLPDAVKGFMENNLFEGMKFLLISIAIGIMGLLYLIPATKQQK